VNAGDGLATSQVQGLILFRGQGYYRVQTDSGVVRCTISSRLRKQLIYPIADPGSLRHHVVEVRDIREVDPVAIGDAVRLTLSADGTGQIVEVLPRKNKVSRKAAGPRPLEQVMAANIDHVVAVCSLAQPVTTWNLIDRYLAAAEVNDLHGVIIATKADLADPAEYEPELAVYRGIGYTTLVTSAADGIGIDAARALLTGSIALFVGRSGAGKTTLLNTIEPGLGLRVAEVSAVTGKGKHTTSHLELFTLSGGGGVIDAPGMREFGLWDQDRADVQYAFPELRPYAGACKFGLGCRHRSEPGCALQQAVNSGAVTPRRFDSFLKIVGSPVEG
jgi:ribosome biogenesis GTPase